MVLLLLRWFVHDHCNRGRGSPDRGSRSGGDREDRERADGKKTEGRRGRRSYLGRRHERSRWRARHRSTRPRMATLKRIHLLNPNLVIPFRLLKHSNKVRNAKTTKDETTVLFVWEKTSWTLLKLQQSIHSSVALKRKTIPQYRPMQCRLNVTRDYLKVFHGRSYLFNAWILPALETDGSSTKCSLFLSVSHFQYSHFVFGCSS